MSRVEFELVFERGYVLKGQVKRSEEYGSDMDILEQWIKENLHEFSFSFKIVGDDDDVTLSITYKDHELINSCEDPTANGILRSDVLKLSINDIAECLLTHTNERTFKTLSNKKQRL